MPRYHESKRRSGVDHHADSFNDERKHGKDHDGMGFKAHADVADEHYGARTRGMERSGSDMIHSNPRAVANLPQEVMMRPYPRTGPYLPEGLNDTITEVDDQMDYDDGKRKSHFYPKKV